MQENQNIAEITGYITIAETARKLGVSYARVMAYVDNGRLDILTVADTIFISEKSVEQFKRRSKIGRPRVQTPRWRKSPKDANFIIATIFVHMYTGQKPSLLGLLEETWQKQHYLFPKTIARYISEDDLSPGTIEIQLIWKQSEMPDEATYQEQLEAFKETFKDVLDWQTARYSTKTVLLHT